MMNDHVLPKIIVDEIDKIVSHYVEKKDTYERSAKNIYNLFIDHKEISPLIHSIKYRVKDPEHLRSKLKKKAIELKRAGKNFDIKKDNVFDKIHDLAGVRILHLHTEQMSKIAPAILNILDEEKYKIYEGPVANTWDDEYRQFFQNISIETKKTDSMYTSVHYVIEINNKAQIKCELQVRTLMEEVWGEVSHTIDYPDETKSIACQEQLKVLARVTSSGTRLVDSIFKSYEEYKSNSNKQS